MKTTYSCTTDELVEGQKIQSLVKLSVEEMIEKPRKFLVDFLAMTALGKEHIGKFYLDEFIIDPVGMIHKDIVFEVTGIARKHTKKPKETLKEIKKVKKTKK
jgi:hypothetical protein